MYVPSNDMENNQFDAKLFSTQHFTIPNLIIIFADLKRFFNKN